MMNERIGTMGFTPTGGYIIGASDKGNADFQEKSRNITEFNQGDTVELSCVKKMDMISENYEDYTKITKKPIYCFSDNYGLEMQNSIHASVLSYCKGELTDEQIKKIFMDACKDMRVYQTQSGHTSGVDAGDNRRIIEEMYEIFQKSNVRGMTYMCFKAGSDIAAANGGNERANWVYYDSKYYDESQHLRDLLQKAAEEMVADWNTDSVDFEKIEKESGYTLDGGLDFNSVWNWRAAQRGICSISEEWQPQDKFAFFYQENKNKVFSGEITLDSQAGVCIVWFGDRKWTMEVPFNGSTVLGKLADHFNAKDLFVKSTQCSEFNLLKYLENFSVYTRFYGHNKTIRGEW